MRKAYRCSLYEDECVATYSALADSLSDKRDYHLIFANEI
jgi:hypothetical protein